MGMNIFPNFLIGYVAKLVNAIGSRPVGVILGSSSLPIITERVSVRHVVIDGSVNKP